MRVSRIVRCPSEGCDNRQVGTSPFPVLVTGVVDYFVPPSLEDGGEDGIEGYHPCRNCHQWVRWEVVPRNELKLALDIAA
jgi:hypothetical protein